MATRYRRYSNNPRSGTDFEQRWGIAAHELAKSEGVSTATIHMRVMRFGTPYQRRAEPTLCEILHNRTAFDLAQELNVTMVTIKERIMKWGDAYYIPESHKSTCRRGWVLKPDARHRNPGARTRNYWLHPDHPEYDTWWHKPEYEQIRQKMSAKKVML